jgi:hypothetical protein
MPELPVPIIVACAVMAAILLFGLVVGLGTLAVRWLRLPADPPEEAAFEPPTPSITGVFDPAAARQRAALWLQAAALGRRARQVLLKARAAADLAAWIAAERSERAASARQEAGAAAAAADAARAAFTAGDESALAAAELAASTAAAQLETLAHGLPDWRAAERRKLLLLTAALVAALAMAAGAMWLR